MPVPKHQFYKPFLGILFRDERLGGGLLLGRALLLFLNFFHQFWNSLFDLKAIRKNFMTDVFEFRSTKENVVD